MRTHVIDRFLSAGAILLLEVESKLSGEMESELDRYVAGYAGVVLMLEIARMPRIARR